MSPSPAPESSKPKSTTQAHKPPNVFSNDGSFLDRFKKNAAPPVDKEKEEREKALARKKAIEDRFKKRGKRPVASTSSIIDEDSSNKKIRKDEGEGELTEYQKEVRRLTGKSLKEQGYDMRPLLK
ncbi:hypothetical protein JCM5353_008054 [Sporobolomyces roseus]